jgi:hypothetical protein
MPSKETPYIDRRRRLRFPMATDLRYKVLGSHNGDQLSGIGIVRDISSKGLAFRINGPLQPGLRLHVSMAWPATLGDGCLLRLVFDGVVLRVRGDLAVVTIDRPEFRTAGKITAPARQEMAVVTASIESLLDKSLLA